MYLRIKSTVKNITQVHLSDIGLLQNKNLKPHKYINTIFESLAGLKNDKINISMLSMLWKS